MSARSERIRSLRPDSGERVIPVMVEDPDTKLEPVITMPDKIRSQQEVEILVEEKNRQEMTYTLAVVD